VRVPEQVYGFLAINTSLGQSGFARYRFMSAALELPKPNEGGTT
jgi:hypothetical protein